MIWKHCRRTHFHKELSAFYISTAPPSFPHISPPLLPPLSPFPLVRHPHTSARPLLASPVCRCVTEPLLILGPCRHSTCVSFLKMRSPVTNPPFMYTRDRTSANTWPLSPFRLRVVHVYALVHYLRRNRAGGASGRIGRQKCGYGCLGFSFGVMGSGCFGVLAFSRRGGMEGFMRNNSIIKNVQKSLPIGFLPVDHSGYLDDPFGFVYILSMVKNSIKVEVFSLTMFVKSQPEGTDFTESYKTQYFPSRTLKMST